MTRLFRFSRIRCLMQHLAMRREKTQMVDGKPLVALPDKTINLESLEFSEDERTLYDAMHKEGKLIVNKYFYVYLFVFFLFKLVKKVFQIHKRRNFASSLRTRFGHSDASSSVVLSSLFG